MANFDFKVRTVIIGGVVYMRMVDAAAYLQELASTEETDVRNRLNAAADALAHARPEQNKKGLANDQR